MKIKKAGIENEDVRMKMESVSGEIEGIISRMNYKWLIDFINIIIIR